MPHDDREPGARPSALPDDQVTVTATSGASSTFSGENAEDLAASLRYAFRDLGFLPPSNLPRAEPRLRIVLRDGANELVGTVDVVDDDGFATLPGQMPRILDPDVTQELIQRIEGAVARREAAGDSQ